MDNQILQFIDNALFAGLFGTILMYIAGTASKSIRRGTNVIVEMLLVFFTIVLGISFIFPVLNGIKLAWNFY